jgi:hypothetical protein
MKLFNDALGKYKVITLVFEKWYKDIRCQVHKELQQTISGRGQI